MSLMSSAWKDHGDYDAMIQKPTTSLDHSLIPSLCFCGTYKWPTRLVVYFTMYKSVNDRQRTYLHLKALIRYDRPT